jgi:dienelactone hydrolase
MQASSRFTRLIFLSCLLVAFHSNALSQALPFWGDLPKGPFAVGFKSLWQLDYSRSYHLDSKDKAISVSAKAPRPILINIWYPARATTNAKAMLHRDYLKIESSAPQLREFSRKLIEYNRGVIVKEISGKSQESLNDKEKLLVEAFFNTPTASIRNATPQSGRFPLIIYHSGAGSSIEDNTVLCEFLASNGYVVINSAYQRADGSSLNIDGGEGSALDIRYLIAYASRLPYVNWNKIGTLGHSLGAQAIIISQTRSNSIVDALVSLDTTQDYHAVSMPLWNNVTEPVLNNIKNMSVPALVVADKHAIFQLWDRLQYAERYYFTTSHLEHNDFISQGLLQRAFSQKADAKEPENKSRDNTLQQELDLARKDYQVVCRSVLNFFNTFLKGDNRGKDSLLSQYQGTSFDGADPHIEYVPKQVTSPEKYDVSSSIPPSPRQVRHILTNNGIGRTLDLLKKFWQKDSTHPIYNLDFAFDLVCDLLHKGKTDDAGEIYKLYTELDGKFQVSIIRRLLVYGEYFPNHAIYFFKKVLILEPGNLKAAEKLKEIESKGANSKPKQ